MRSSVSVILSSPTPDPNMSRPDYEQTVHDHASLLILVRCVGDELKDKYFTQLFERVNKISHLKIQENSGNERTIWPRFVKEYPVGNNDWGDFQTHRRLLGLVTFGKCRNDNGLNEICRLHESLKVKYQATLYDSRCVIFGVNTDSTPKIEPPSNFRSQPIYYSAETDANSDLDVHIKDFMSSLFWILESKRLDKSKEKLDKVSLLLAPFEKKDIIGLDKKAQNSRKRCAARLTKHLGDLSLQAGLPNEALSFYHTSMETLRSISDWLWIGSCAEGLCAASAQYLLPKSETQLHRNASLQDKSVRRRSSVGMSTCEKPASSHPRNILTPDDIYKMFREAIIHYSKYQNAAVIETEACFKGARIAVRYNSSLQAHTLLYNVIFINLNQNEEDKIQRFMTLSTLYSSIGFHRKASFYRRLTATRYVSARNPHTNWEQCYQLMLQSLPGYNLSLDPNEYSTDNIRGWPRLQRQVLQDLVIASTRLRNNGLATRHMTFLLQTMWDHIPSSERLDAALQLKKLAELCEGAPVPLVLDNGFVIPPANLLNIPQPINFVVQNLKVHLRPYQLQPAIEDYGPFLFTPLNLGSLDRKKMKNDSRLEYRWVADEICEVILEVGNPLAFDLDITNILLLTSGVVFESIPVSVVLPGNSSSQSIVLTGIPKEVGELEIKGYSTHTLGVKSNCRLRHIPAVPHSSLFLEVIPALPVLGVSIQTDGSISENGNNSIAVLYAGESSECSLKFKNTGVLPIEFLEMNIESNLDADLQNQILQWNQLRLHDQLPLDVGATASLSLQIFGASDFLIQNYQSLAMQDTISSRGSLLSGSGSIPSVPCPKPVSYEKNTPFSASTFSFRSGESSFNSYSSSQFKNVQDLNQNKVIEFHVKIRYSGGPGYSSGYCRTCSLVLHVEILNSILITNWDVIPAETSSQFYLVLDVLNLTNQEIEVNYTKLKLIQIEEGETCRIPIPVDRCPLSLLESSFDGKNDCLVSLEMNKTCSDHIASQVDLRWRMSHSDRTGYASVNGLTLSPGMLDIVRVSPINWEIVLNSVPIKNSVSFTHSVGETLELGVWLHNSLAFPLTDIVLQMYFFQDYQNGIINVQLDSCLTAVGSTQVKFSQVLEHGSVYHELNVVFFNSGVYKLNVQCCSLNQCTWKLIPPFEINVTD